MRSSIQQGRSQDTYHNHLYRPMSQLFEQGGIRGHKACTPEADHVQVAQQKGFSLSSDEWGRISFAGAMSLRGNLFSRRTERVKGLSWEHYDRIRPM